jgi:fidgetin-like protein 1
MFNLGLFLLQRLYIPLPDREGRAELVRRLLLQDEDTVVRCDLSEADIEGIVDRTAGFSGADIRFLCTEAAMGPVRELAFSSGFAELDKIVATEVPPIAPRHFEEALSVLSASVSQEDLEKYIAWNATFGTYRRME